MRVSVIITVYNVERYIERCISSILNQTYKDFELLVVNDGTPDRSMAIAENFASNDKRIRIVNHGDNVGLMCARRRGYVEAKGDYIFFDTMKALQQSLIAKHLWRRTRARLRNIDTKLTAKARIWASVI